VAIPKTRILTRAYQEEGARGVLDVLTEKLRATWRRGEVWQLGRFLGLPTDIVRLDGCKFTIDGNFVPANVVDLLLSDRYEESERVALRKFLDPALPVVELGGCIGVISCLTNRRLRDPRRHVVVEANTTLLPILRQNRERNSCQFEIVHAALSHDSETIPFRVNDNILASSLRGEEQRAVIVSTVTLKRLLDEHGFERATLICDIEGAELQLVEKEIETLSERVVTIIMELHGRMVGEEPTRRMLARLENAGFQMVQRTGDVVVLQNRPH
jgi:FkbM family methyltransferase